MNVLIVGANASLAKNLVEKLNDHKVYVLGRTPPSYLKDFTHTHFVKRIYTDEPHLNDDIDLNEPLAVIFCGISSEAKLLVDLKREELVSEFFQNVGFSHSVISEVLPGMIKNEFGRIIFMGSKISSQGVAGGGSYEVIKSAQKGLSRTLAVEYGRFGITSNVIEIGYLKNGYSEKLGERFINNLISRIPQRNSIEPEEIAMMVNLVLATPSINGSVLAVDQAIL